MKNEEDWTAEKVMKCVRNRFSERQKYVVLEGVPNGTGYSVDGWVDAVVFSLWPSFGCKRLALEIKISRADFIRELQNPEKNAWVRDVCHEFAYVTPSGVAKEEELPQGVGLYVCSGDSIRAVRVPAAKSDMKVDDIAMAGFVRAMQKEIDREVDAARKDICANDENARNAFFWEGAVKTFLNKHGVYFPRLAPGKEAIDAIQALESATMSKADEHIRDQLIQQTEYFRRSVCDAFGHFLQFAQIGILETDKMGDFILSQYSKDSFKEAVARWKKEREKTASLIIDSKKAETKETPNDPQMGSQGSGPFQVQDGR